ncbi:MAG: hypothetical protein EPN67_04055, partial [Pusillimonas sp.]
MRVRAWSRRSWVWPVRGLVMSEAVALRKPVRRPAWLRAVRQGLDDGGAQVLVTVAQVKGSAPRDAGARMWVNASGAHDTIGGGRLEQQ